MAEQAVPFKVGRRALVRCPFRGRWMEGVGRVSYDEAGWETYTLDDDGEPISDVWVGEEAPTALLPGQCASCYEVGRHAEGCAGPAGLSPEEVAANIARGVPAFWARWAMWEWPQPGGDVTILALHGGWRPVVCYFDSLKQGWVGGLRSLGGIGHRDGIPLVAFDINGPTLAPWRR